MLTEFFRIAYNYSEEQNRVKEKYEDILNIQFDPGYSNQLYQRFPSKKSIPNCPEDQY